MGYDAWKSTDTGDVELRWTPDNDVAEPFAAPLYRLHLFHDRGLRHTVARWQMMRSEREGWRTVDEAVVQTHGLHGFRVDESYSAAIAQLRANRRYQHALARGSR